MFLKKKLPLLMAIFSTVVFSKTVTTTFQGTYSSLDDPEKDREMVQDSNKMRIKCNQERGKGHATLCNMKAKQHLANLRVTEAKKRAQNPNFKPSEKRIDYNLSQMANRYLLENSKIIRKKNQEEENMRSLYSSLSYGAVKECLGTCNLTQKECFQKCDSAVSEDLKKQMFTYANKKIKVESECGKGVAGQLVKTSNVNSIYCEDSNKTLEKFQKEVEESIKKCTSVRAISSNNYKDLKRKCDIYNNEFNSCVQSRPESICRDEAKLMAGTKTVDRKLCKLKNISKTNCLSYILEIKKCLEKGRDVKDCDVEASPKAAPNTDENKKTLAFTECEKQMQGKPEGSVVNCPGLGSWKKSGGQMLNILENLKAMEPEDITPAASGRGSGRAVQE